jgi:hypothetical protein
MLCFCQCLPRSSQHLVADYVCPLPCRQSCLSWEPANPESDPILHFALKLMPFTVHRPWSSQLCPCWPPATQAILPQLGALHTAGYDVWCLAVPPSNRANWSELTVTTSSLVQRLLDQHQRQQQFQGGNNSSSNGAGGKNGHQSRKVTVRRQGPRLGGGRSVHAEAIMTWTGLQIDSSGIMCMSRSACTTIGGCHTCCRAPLKPSR